MNKEVYERVRVLLMLRIVKMIRATEHLSPHEWQEGQRTIKLSRKEVLRLSDWTVTPDRRIHDALQAATLICREACQGSFDRDTRTFVFKFNEQAYIKRDTLYLGSKEYTQHQTDISESVWNSLKPEAA